MRSFQEWLYEETTLQYHDTLNPALWDADVLKPEVRTACLTFIEMWRSGTKIPAELVEDVILTGGNANYNWAPTSDIDVHLLIDRSKLSSDPTLIDDYLQAIKSLWQDTHNPTIYGYSLEPYAEDSATIFPKDQGVYSLTKNEWLQHPVFGHHDFANNILLQKKVKYYTDRIEDLIKSDADLEAFDTIKEKIKNMRAIGIQKFGEFAWDNMVFKELRNAGVLDKMSKYIRDKKDSEISLYYE